MSITKSNNKIEINSVDKFIEGNLEQLHNSLAEQIVLGSILDNNNNINDIADFLEDNHFYIKVHQRIYETIFNLIERGLLANPVVLKNKFEDDQALQEHGGAEYLNNLVRISRSEIFHLDYAKIIKDLYLKRQLIESSREAIQNVYKEDDIIADQHIEKLEQKMMNLAEHGTSNKEYHEVRQSLKAVFQKTEALLENGQKVIGVPSGYDSVDGHLGGFKPSELIIVAARPGMGKTAFALNLADNAAKYFQETAESDKEQKAVGFFSLEMSSEQLSSRMLSMAAEINSFKINTGRIDQNQLEQLSRAFHEIQDRPIYIDDTPALTINAIKTKARRMYRQKKIGILFVDYLQLIRVVDNKRERNRVQEISEISQGLKHIAKELNIPVVALSQLSRDVEKRENKRPMLSDLRESGSIEQDADVVMFIYRDAYYNQMHKDNSKENENPDQQEQKDLQEITANIIVAKNRSGPVGDLVLKFDSEHTKFSNFQYG